MYRIAACLFASKSKIINFVGESEERLNVVSRLGQVGDDGKVVGSPLIKFKMRLVKMAAA